MPAPAVAGARPGASGERRVNLPLVTRDLEIRTGSFNAEARTVDVVFTTGARGARFDWNRWDYIDEELATGEENVRLDRLNGGAPVLNQHNRYDLSDQIGVVVEGSARMEGGLGIATIRLSAREDVAPIVQDIADGIIRNVSVGYAVHSYEITENDGQRPLYRAVDWEPYEISFVSVPFDGGAQTRSHDAAQGGFPCIICRASPASEQEERQMDEDEVQAGGAPATNAARDAGNGGQEPQQQQQQQQEPQQQRSADSVTVGAIRAAVRNAGLGDDVAFSLIERHESTPLTREALMADIGRRFAERDAPAQTNGRVPARPGNGVTMVRAMGDALLHRMAPNFALTDAGRDFRGLGMLRMAEEIIAASGVNTRGMSRVEIAERALHGTTDFSALMGGVLSRRLRMAYEENQPTYRLWARRAPNAPDFREQDVIQVSAMPDLLRTSESGEFKYGTISDGKVSYGLLTYGRIIGLTRQLLINDDLRALERITTGYAAAAARLENRTVYAQLTANPVMNDGTPLFHADHGNLAAAGAAISAATLGDGRKRMRLQKGLQGEELNLSPSWLIVPASLEQVAYQFTSSNYVPAKQTDVNEFRQGGRTSVEPVVEAILDGVSAAAWYLAASTAQVDTVEYSYLDGAEGVQLSSRPGFTVDGMEFKASLDFAAATIDWRGLDKNPGAA